MCVFFFFRGECLFHHPPLSLPLFLLLTMTCIVNWAIDTRSHPFFFFFLQGNWDDGEEARAGDTLLAIFVGVSQRLLCVCLFCLEVAAGCLEERAFGSRCVHSCVCVGGGGVSCW